MKRKRVILAVSLLGAAVAIGMFLTAIAPVPARPMAVAFVAFTNALPFLGAPEEVRSLGAVFQVTNHLARTMTYHSEAHGSQIRGKGSSVTHASNELPGHGTGTFMLSTAAGTNGWKFVVVSSSSRPRPAWQHRVYEISKRLGTRPVFVGPARTYPQFTNVWTTPES